jgi:hypothetical protein
MAGILRVEVSGATKEELKKQLEDVIRELDKVNFQPGRQVSFGPQAWKTVNMPVGQQAWKTVDMPVGPQAWKTVNMPMASQAWKVVAAPAHPWKLTQSQWDPGKSVPGGQRAWKVYYET